MSTRTAPYDQPQSLMHKTTALLQTHDLIQVSAATKISFYWLVALMRGTCKNPSVNRVQYLYEYLTKKPLI